MSDDGKVYKTVDELIADLNKPNEKLKKKIGEKRFNTLCEIDNQYHRWIAGKRLQSVPSLVYRLRKINIILKTRGKLCQE